MSSRLVGMVCIFAVGLNPYIGEGQVTGDTLTANAETISNDSPNQPEHIPSQIVVIDPGHGGQDEGIHCGGCVPEKKLVLQVALEIKKKLRQHANIEVFLTRERDMNMSVLERVAFANKKEADVFVSLHQAMIEPLLKEPVLRVYTNQTVQDDELSRVQEKYLLAGIKVIPWDLAQNRQTGQSEKLGVFVRKNWEGGYKMAGSEVQSQYPKMMPLAVLRGIHAPAVLVELPFSLSEDEQDQEVEPDMTMQTEMAVRISGGIMRFLANR